MQHLFKFSSWYPLSYQVKSEYTVEDPLSCQVWNQFLPIKDQYPIRKNHEDKEAEERDTF